MNPLLKMMLSRLMKPAGDDGADTGGTDTGTAEVDRGDVVDPALTADNLTSLVDANDDGSGDADLNAGAKDDPPAAAGEGGADDAGGDQGRPAAAGIPKGRFNEVNQQRKEAQAALALANKELERYRAQEAAAAKAPSAAPAPAAVAPAQAPAAATPTDLDAQEEAYEQALIEGDTKKAAQIRRAMNESMLAQAKAEAVQELTQRQTAQLLETTAKNVNDAFPYLSTEAGAEALDLILAARDRKFAKGMPAHLALLEAANTIAPKFAPEGEDTPSRVSDSTPSAKDLRPAAALARGAADSTAQPPALQAGIGQRATATRVNVAQLTEEQFEALTPAEKSRLRGD
ncbi:MAG: hypothetical protein ACK4OE_04555 [Acidovorax sp.]|uniref:hypothetical protein n=1 Tax=Acidovorax sp. TaxID=1872122 RepID=UPI00391BC848